MIDALGDWPIWTYAIASSLYGDPTDKGMPAYQAVIKRYKAEKNAPDPWHIVAFGQLLTTVRFLNEAGASNASSITPKTVLARAKAFKGPLALGSPKLQCGKYKDAPAHLQRHVPGVHVPGQVRVQAGVRLDRAAQVAVDEPTTRSTRRGRSTPAPSADPHGTT